MRMIITLLLTQFSLPAMAQYSVQRTGEVVQLVDSATRTSVSVVPSMGNRVTAMTVNGVNVLYFPYASLDEFKQKPALCGIPLLAPWGNRLDEMAFYAKGKNQKIEVLIGPNYHAAIVFAPNRGAGQQGRGADRGTGGPPTGAGAGAAGAGAGGDRGGARGTPGGAATQTQAYICFEPMAGVIDALNLAHEGLYKELQSIPAGGVWKESFWVRPSGF